MIAETLARGKQMLRERRCENLEEGASADGLALRVKGNSMVCEAEFLPEFQGGRPAEPPNCDCLAPG